MMMTIGRIYKSMANEIYAEQRFEKLVKEDGTDKSVLLREYILDRTKKKFVRINDIIDKAFEVIVDTGPTFANKRRETISLIKEVLSITPPESPHFDVLYAALIENLEGPGLDRVKKFNRKQLIVMGLEEPESDEEKQMVEQLNAPKPPDPTEELIAAAAEKERTEAGKNQTDSVENLASAALKEAQADKVVAEAFEIRSETQRENRRAGIQIASAFNAINSRARELAPAI
jgi:hypothetical protein